MIKAIKWIKKNFNSSFREIRSWKKTFDIKLKLFLILTD